MVEAVTPKYLYLSNQIVPRIKLALRVLVGDRSTEVLPALKNIFLEGLQSSGSAQEGIEQFVAAQQVPKSVAFWEFETCKEDNDEKEDDEHGEDEDVDENKNEGKDEEDEDEDDADGNGNDKVENN